MQPGNKPHVTLYITLHNHPSAHSGPLANTLAYMRKKLGILPLNYEKGPEDLYAILQCIQSGKWTDQARDLFKPNLQPPEGFTASSVASVAPVYHTWDGHPCDAGLPKVMVSGRGDISGFLSWLERQGYKYEIYYRKVDEA